MNVHDYPQSRGATPVLCKLTRGHLQPSTSVHKVCDTDKAQYRRRVASGVPVPAEQVELAAGFRWLNTALLVRQFDGHCEQVWKFADRPFPVPKAKERSPATDVCEAVASIREQPYLTQCGSPHGDWRHNLSDCRTPFSCSCQEQTWIAWRGPPLSNLDCHLPRPCVEQEPVSRIVCRGQSRGLPASRSCVRSCLTCASFLPS